MNAGGSTRRGSAADGPVNPAPLGSPSSPGDVIAAVGVADADGKRTWFANGPTPPETGNEGMATAGAEEPVPASAATSAVKPPEADEARCIVASPVEKDGVAYAIGQDILLSEDEAKLLIAGGSVTPVVIEGADAP